MNEDQMQEVLDELFYKPSWNFRVIKDWTDRPMLRIDAELLDSTTWPIDHSKTARVVQYGYLPPFEEPEHLVKFLTREIDRLEKHESREWLRRKSDGKPIDDPHAYDRRE